MIGLKRFAGMVLGMPILLIAIFNSSYRPDQYQWLIMAGIAFGSAFFGAGITYGFSGYSAKYISFGDFKDPNNLKMSSTMFCFMWMLFLQFFVITLLPNLG